MSANDDAPHASWWKRIGWLLLIWTLSVAALGAVAFMLEWMMRAAGLAS
ncbi:MAG TPA: DUF2474 domain-containing protein [Burkholderiales bacterium]|jgi:Protein of unknown function (DUF2474)|nr:DUF2474 domain-containing protein [Burkholderiales bacterium]